MKCCCMQTADCDHKRSHAEKHGFASWAPGNKLVRDFIIEGADQSACWLHPNHANDAVAYGELGDQAARAPPLVAPPSGPGFSQGHGAYRWYKDAKTQQKLKFDKRNKTSDRSRGSRPQARRESTGDRSRDMNRTDLVFCLLRVELRTPFVVS